MRAERALSIRQPWADLVLDGLKTVETRTWRTNYRGLLGVHASQKPDLDALVRFDRAAASDRLGALLGHVFLVDCRPMTRDDEMQACTPYRDGLWAWVLAKPKEHDPEPMRGGLGLWRLAPPKP